MPDPDRRAAPTDLMPPTPVLETARLWLCPASPADIPSVQRRFPQWEVVKFLSARAWPYPGDGSAANMAETLGDLVGGKAIGACSSRMAAREAIGRISLWPDDGESRDMRGFWLDPEFWARA